MGATDKTENDEAEMKKMKKMDEKKNEKIERRKTQKQKIKETNLLKGKTHKTHTLLTTNQKKTYKKTISYKITKAHIMFMVHHNRIENENNMLNQYELNHIEKKTYI